MSLWVTSMVNGSLKISQVTSLLTPVKPVLPNMSLGRLKELKSLWLKADNNNDDN